MPDERRVCVIGAGLVGCVASLYLSKRGYSVEVFESRLDPRAHPPKAGRSLALVVSARGFRALGGVGMDEVVRGMSIPLRGRVVHHRTGDRGFHPYGVDGQAIYCVSRTTLNAALVDALEQRGIPVHFGMRCSGIDLRAPALMFEQRETGGHSRVLGARVLAADGAFSSVRASMMKTDRFDYSQQYVEYGYKELTIPAEGGDGWCLEPNSTHVWPRGGFMLTAFPMTDRSFTCTFVLPFEGEPSFGSIRASGDVRALFEREFADALPKMPDLEAEFFDRPTASLVSIRCFPWVHGGVALIGDAAHSMVPFFGQGMNAGFEDCQVLADCLERHSDDWPSALSDYQALRKPNCDAVTELSLRHFAELSHRTGDPRFIVQKQIEQKIHRMYPDRFVPLYTRVAFTDAPYIDALRAGEQQATMLEELMSLPDIEDRWDTLEVEGVIHRLIARA